MALLAASTLSSLSPTSPQPPPLGGSHTLRSFSNGSPLLRSQESHGRMLQLGGGALARAALATLATAGSPVASQEIGAKAINHEAGGVALHFTLAGWLGVASVLAAPEANAAVQELATLADNDSRGLLLLGVLVPAIGWVLFNILPPALNQISRMKTTKGVVVSGALGAGLLSAGLAEAAVQELASLGDNDARGTLLLAVLVPAIGWVLFNILQPALKQIDRMRGQK